MSRLKRARVVVRWAFNPHPDAVINHWTGRYFPLSARAHRWCATRVCMRAAIIMGVRCVVSTPRCDSDSPAAAAAAESPGAGMPCKSTSRNTPRMAHNLEFTI